MLTAIGHTKVTGGPKWYYLWKFKMAADAILKNDKKWCIWVNNGFDFLKNSINNWRKSADFFVDIRYGSLQSVKKVHNFSNISRQIEPRL